MAALAGLGLGLERGAVALVPHDPRWADAFSLVQRALRDAAPALAVHHVGSTAIEGIPAKPILDVLATAPSLAALDDQRDRLVGAGFTWKGEYGLEGRRYCVLYDEAARVAFVHLHAYAEEHPDVAALLLFRDHLRAHPARAEAYAALKLALAAEVSREEYTGRKAPLIRTLLAEAAGSQRDG